MGGPPAEFPKQKAGTVFIQCHWIFLSACFLSSPFPSGRGLSLEIGMLPERNNPLQPHPAQLGQPGSHLTLFKCIFIVESIADVSLFPHWPPTPPHSPVTQHFWFLLSHGKGCCFLFPLWWGCWCSFQTPSPLQCSSGEWCHLKEFFPFACV